MKTSPSALRSPVLLLAMLALVIGGGAWLSMRAQAGTPEATPAPVAAQPYSLALLPEYQAGVPAPAASDVVDRTLFNPTRRPAPPAVVVAESAKPKMQKGQFALSGTMMIDNIVMAFLRESQGGKSRRVRQGESLNGMTVVEIKPDRVRLALGDESEDLVLKVVAGPKTTIQPVMPGANRGPVTASSGAAANAAANAAGGPGAPRDVAEVLAERRRQARAQEQAAAQGQAAGGGAAAPPPPPRRSRPPPCRPCRKATWVPTIRAGNSCTSAISSRAADRTPPIAIIFGPGQGSRRRLLPCMRRKRQKQ